MYGIGGVIGIGLMKKGIDKVRYMRMTKDITIRKG
jgi:hypothetical protein